MVLCFTTARSRALSRPILTTVLIVTALLLTGVALNRARTTATAKRNPPSAGSASKSDTTKHDRLIREGTEIVGRLGYFRMAGDRVTFFTADGEGRFVGLENLNLQRIATAIADRPDERQWKVDGTITEYRGRNFLLVGRAVLKNWTSPQEQGLRRRSVPSVPPSGDKPVPRPGTPPQVFH